MEIARKGLEGRPTNDPPAEVADAGDPLEVAAILTDLNERGVQRLLVEGGGHIHTMFLTSGLVDELRLAVAPFFIGDTSAPRFLMSGTIPSPPRPPCVWSRPASSEMSRSCATA